MPTIAVPRGFLDIKLKLAPTLLVSAGTTPYVIICYAPTIGIGIPVGLGSIVLTTYAPAIASTQIAFPVPVGSITLTPYAPTDLTTQTAVPVGAGSLTLTGLLPALSTLNALIPVPVGALTLSGHVTSPLTSTTIFFMGYAPTINIKIATGLASLIITGYKPRIRFGQGIFPARIPLESERLTPFQDSTVNAAWLDVNSRFKQVRTPLLLPNVRAINNSLFNLFKCPIGSRGRIMQPTYGTYIYALLQEPIDPITARKVRASLIQSIEKWEPRIQIDYSRTFVQPDTALAGYVVQVRYFYVATGEPVVAEFHVQA